VAFGAVAGHDLLSPRQQVGGALAGRLRASPELEVVDGVARVVAITVMYGLALAEWSAKVLLHHMAVFQNLPPIDRDNPVAVTLPRALLSARWGHRGRPAGGAAHNASGKGRHRPPSACIPQPHTGCPYVCVSPTGSLKMWTDSLEADSGGPGRLPGPEPDKETTLWSNRARALALSTQLLISDMATIVPLVGQCPTGLRRSG